MHKPPTIPTTDGQPMADAERARHARERITYPPDQMPWKARAMFAPTTDLPDLSHRSSNVLLKCASDYLAEILARAAHQSAAS